MKHCDADILQLLDAAVPPAELTSVAVFRSAVQRYQKQVGRIQRRSVFG